MTEEKEIHTKFESSKVVIDLPDKGKLTPKYH